MQRFTEQLAELAERLDDQRLRALTRSNRSILESEVGDVARAISLADEALELMRQVGDAYAYGFFQNVAASWRDSPAMLVPGPTRRRPRRQAAGVQALPGSRERVGMVSANQGDWSSAAPDHALQNYEGLGDVSACPVLLSAAGH